jgi:hypothetical protein
MFLAHVLPTFVLLCVGLALWQHKAVSMLAFGMAAGWAIVGLWVLSRASR